MSFDELLIRHSSPTLAGIKPASLINLRFLEGGTDSIDSLKEKGLSFMLLTGQSGYPLLLVYRLSAINEILKSPVAKSLLEKNGYKSSEPEKALEHLMQLVAVCGKSIQILNEPLHSVKDGTDAESPTQSSGKTEWKLQGYA